MLHWFRDYLSDRPQFVSFLNAYSSRQQITCCVPQGSILGPLLFLIYINDLASVSSDLYSILFADDTNVFVTGDNLQSITAKMNDGLNNIVDWLCANRLSLNINKTKFMVFKPRRRIPAP